MLASDVSWPHLSSYAYVLCSFSHLLQSTGGQALEVLQYLFSNDLDVPVGHIVHTGMLNHNGGYENDCSIARLNKRSFFMISPTDQQVHCWAWLKKHMPEDSNLFLEDVTWKYTGEGSCQLLDWSGTPLDQDREMSVGYANGIRVMSMTHTGEPGFMLYIPIEYALHVYNEVMSVGQKYGIRNSGYYALRSLRIEKFFAFWGQDLDAFTTPMECGREFRVKLDKAASALKASLVCLGRGAKQLDSPLQVENLGEDGAGGSEKPLGTPSLP
ncbi:hypothetical protein L345_15452, partial [Ophiophagus hannah]